MRIELMRVHVSHLTGETLKRVRAREFPELQGCVWGDADLILTVPDTLHPTLPHDLWALLDWAHHAGHKYLCMNNVSPPMGYLPTYGVRHEVV